MEFKNLLFQNLCAKFNQTWHKTSLDEGDLSFYKESDAAHWPIVF